jgi:hypothetical protein
MAIVAPGQAVWNQRHTLARLSDRLRQLIRAVGRPTDFTLNQWGELLAFTLEFRPDLILELGRGCGNSTCCFLEAASRLRPATPGRLLSLDLGTGWNETMLRLQGLCGPEWFASGDIRVGNILDVDWTRETEGARRILVLWDAHGFEVAECVLGKLLPAIAGRPHAVVMHDLSDCRYDGQFLPAYGDQSLWNGESATTDYFWLGHISSSVAQALSIVDFTTRNKLPLHSASESLHKDIGNDPAKVAELRRLLGDDLFMLSAHWFWFSANEAPGPLTFPRVRSRPQPAPAPVTGPAPVEQVTPAKKAPPVEPRRGPLATRLRRLLKAVARPVRRSA